MPVILPPGKETRWLKVTNSLSDILDMLKKYPYDKMNGYPISTDMSGTGPYTMEMLLPKGEKLLTQSGTPSIPLQKRYGQKKKSDVSHWLGNNPI